MMEKKILKKVEKNQNLTSAQDFKTKTEVADVFNDSSADLDFLKVKMI